MTTELSILVIDDEFDMAELLAELLTARGHRVTVAVNGLIARTLLDSHDYDLVITDMMMPILDGVALVRGMRADHRLAAVPVIMISAQLDVMVSAAEGLVQGVLQKPFSPRDLYDLIARVTET